MTRWLVQKSTGGGRQDLRVISYTTETTAEQVLRDLGWVGNVTVYQLGEPIQLRGVREFKVEHR